MEPTLPASQITQRPAVTCAGLMLAMFGPSLFLWAFRMYFGDADSLPLYLTRQLVVFLMLGALLVLIRKGEGLPFSSIGWHTDRLGNAALWGLLGIVLSAMGLAVCLGIAKLMHWTVGDHHPTTFKPPLWAVTIAMLRAGITEEAFFRGYALTRLLSLTGSKWAAIVLTLVPFALLHYRQGPGILIASVGGLIMTGVFLKRRNLPAVMFAHSTVDFIPNVLLPLLGAG